MLELLFFFVAVAVIGAIACGVAAFTHSVLISSKLAKLHAAIAKLEALKAKL